MEKQKRFAFLDLMKFFAIFFVVLYHGRYIPNDIMGESVTLQSQIVYIVHCILATGVPIFFFVNGFLLINKKLDLKKFTIKTVKLIAITFIWGATGLLVIAATRGESFSPMELLAGLWKWKLGYINYLWFMGALVCIRFIFPLIKSAFDNNRKVFNYFVALCMIIVFGNSILNMITTLTDRVILDGTEYFVDAYSNKDWLNIFNPLAGMKGHAFALFMLGCFVGGNKEKLDKKIESSKILNPFTAFIVFVISTVLYVLWGYYTANLLDGQWDPVWNGYDKIFTLINVIAMYVMFRNYKGSPKNPLSYVIRLVSKNTLGVYFTHQLLLEFLKVNGLTELPFMQNYAVNIVYVLLIVLVCASVSALLKKIPLIKNLF